MKSLNSRKTQLWMVPFAATLCCSVPAAAADKEDALAAPPTIFTDLVACKTIADSEQRLACFDEKVAALESAQASKQVVIADREQVREARRGLFGLSLPRIKLFGDGDESEDVNELSTKIQSASRAGYGKWMIVLEDGATWLQTDSTKIYPYPEPGSDVLIKRGSFGSFTAKVGKGRFFKVKRVVN